MHRQFKALGNHTRLAIVKQLSVSGPAIVDILATRVGVRAAAVSAHLQVLMSAGLVRRQEEGRFVVYDIHIDNIQEVIKALARIAGMEAQENDDDNSGDSENGVWS